MKRLTPATDRAAAPLTVPALLVRPPIVSAALTVRIPAFTTAAVSPKLPPSTSVAPGAMLTVALVEAPVAVRVVVPDRTDNGPPPLVPLTCTVPEACVVPFNVPVTKTGPAGVLPSSVAPPLASSMPARMPPVKRLTPVTDRAAAPLSVPALLVRPPMVSAALTVRIPAFVTAAVSPRLPPSTSVAPGLTFRVVLARLPLRVSVPACTAVIPVKVLALVSTRVPRPVLSRPLLPSRTELMEREPDWTWMKGLAAAASCTKVMVFDTIK